MTGIAGEKSNTPDEVFLFVKERPNILSRDALLNQSKENMHQGEGPSHAKEYVISLWAQIETVNMIWSLTNLETESMVRGINKLHTISTMNNSDDNMQLSEINAQNVEIKTQSKS